MNDGHIFLAFAVGCWFGAWQACQWAGRSFRDFLRYLDEGEK